MLINDSIHNTKKYFSKLKEKIHKNSVMFKILISYLLLTFILFSFFPMILINYFSRNYIEGIKARSNDVMRQSYETANILISSTYSRFLLMNTSDITFMKGLYDENFTTNDIYNICTTLRNEILTSPTVSSIYIYNFKANKVFSSKTGASTINNFEDTSSTEILNNFKENKNRPFISRSIEGKNYISIFYNNISSNGDLMSSLVINMDESSLKEYLVNNSDVSLSNLYIVDNKGNILLSSSHEYDNYIENTDIFEKMKSLDNKNNYFISDINNKNILAIYFKSRGLGWNYISFIDVKILLSGLNSLKIYAIYISIAFVLLSLIFILYCLKSIYTPFYKLINNLKTKNKNKELLILNEYDYLKSTFDILHENIQSLESEGNNSILTKKHNLIMELISVDFSLDPKQKEEMIQVGINVNAKNYMVVVFVIDSINTLKNKYTLQDINILRYGFLNIVNEILSPNYDAELIFDTNSTLISVIALEDSTNNTLKALTTIISNIHNTIIKYLRFSVTSCNGNIVDNINLINISYENAVHFLNYKILTGDNSTINYYDFKAIDLKHINYPYDIEKEILSEIKNKRNDSLQEYLSEFFSQLRDTSFYEIQMYIGQLLISIDRLLKTSSSVELPSNVFNFNDVYTQYSNLNTLDEIEQFIYSQLNLLTMNLKTNKAAKNKKITASIINYIAQNYSDPNLSIEVISDYIGLSPNYIRSIFKENMQISLSNYITEVKISKAKELLENTDYTAKKISILVGFNDNRYFYAVFKKYTNLTTEEYKKQYCKNI